MIIQGTNIQMIRGDTEAIRVSVKDTQGIKVNLVEGDTVYFTVKVSASLETKEFQKIITNFTDGEALITIYSNDTKSMKFRSYLYDIQLNKANGDVKTIIPPSQFIINQEVTHE